MTRVAQNCPFCDSGEEMYYWKFGDTYLKSCYTCIKVITRAKEVLNERKDQGSQDK